MLQITLFPQDETFDEASGKFLPPMNGYVMDLEHSLVSLHAWESKWELPFLSTEDKTVEQTIDYIRFMILGPQPPPEDFARLTPEDITKINEYIGSKQTATTIHEDPRKRKTAREVITAELIYYWMISYNIPVEFQHWHLSKLLTLIQVCSIKNSKNNPQEKQSPSQMAQSRRELNELRKRELGTKG